MTCVRERATFQPSLRLRQPSCSSTPGSQASVRLSQCCFMDLLRISGGKSPSVCSVDYCQSWTKFTKGPLGCPVPQPDSASCKWAGKHSTFRSELYSNPGMCLVCDPPRFSLQYHTIFPGITVCSLEPPTLPSLPKNSRKSEQSQTLLPLH